MSTVTTVYFEEQSHEKQFRERALKSSASEEEEEEEEEGKKKKMIPLFHRRRGSSRSFYSIRNLLFLLIFFTFIFILYSSLSLSPLLRFLDPYSYVLVLDAGSTGTRIHVYKFRATTDNDNGDTFVLKNEVFKERKPGLSSFADHVDQAENQIDELLKIADQEVSRFKHRNTPLVLRATAGLRLLEEKKQKLLLESVSHAFGKYGFYRPKLDIAIMNETEEGIDAWLTLVYLKGEQFYGSRIAALDLGGSSTQITYNPSLANTSLAEKLNLLLKAQQPIELGQINAFRDPANKNLDYFYMVG
jgi:ectonucleoside triphosphate diphosphohydrolase 5/6